MEKYTTILRALADPTRLTILKLVLHQEMCVCELQELLKISQPAVSQHLAKLKTVGIVRERRAGNWTFYQGDLNRVTAELGALLSFMAVDPETIPDLAELVQRRRNISQAELCAGNGPVRPIKSRRRASDAVL